MRVTHLLALPHLQRGVEKGVLNDVRPRAGQADAAGAELRVDPCEHLGEILVRQMMDDLLYQRTVVFFVRLERKLQPTSALTAPNTEMSERCWGKREEKVKIRTSVEIPSIFAASSSIPALGSTQSAS